jgi:hypothetical protein
MRLPSLEEARNSEACRDYHQHNHCGRDIVVFVGVVNHRGRRRKRNGSWQRHDGRVNLTVSVNKNVLESLSLGPRRVKVSDDRWVPSLM